jgi:KaiC/GvpD/RAD55 family RecA-like ATPase
MGEDVGKTAESLKEALQAILNNAQNDRTAFDENIKKRTLENVSKPNDSAIKTEMKVVETKTFMDKFFLDQNGKQLNGVPKVAQVGIVGNPDVGKSLLAQELALRLTSEGHKTVLILNEDIWETTNERFDLQSRMKLKANFLGLDWQAIKTNLYVIDVLSHSEFRVWENLVGTYRQLVEVEKTEFLVVDSVTLLENYRGNLKARLEDFISYNQVNGIGGFYVFQKAQEDDVDKFGIAGGIGLGFLLDIMFEINIKKVWSGDAQMKIDTGAIQGEMLHFIRVLKCRLGKADMLYHRVQIDINGILKLIK